MKHDEATENAVEHFEERAAIREYDGGLKRIHAESLALKDVVQRFGHAAGKVVQSIRRAKEKWGVQ